MKDLCGPYFVYTVTGGYTVRPYTEVEQPLDSTWAAETIARWRLRMQARRAR